jgi:hypothetical protein
VPLSDAAQERAEVWLQAIRAALERFQTPWGPQA